MLRSHEVHPMVNQLHQAYGGQMPLGQFIKQIQPERVGCEKRMFMYKPIKVTVQTAGTVTNRSSDLRNVEVHVHENGKWFDTLKKRVGDLIGNPALVADLRTTDDRSIKDFTPQQVVNAGLVLIYSENGAPVRCSTPPSITPELSVKKSARLDDWFKRDIRHSDFSRKVANHLATYPSLAALEKGLEPNGTVASFIAGEITSKKEWTEFVRTHTVDPVMQHEYDPAGAKQVAADIADHVRARIVDMIASDFDKVQLHYSVKERNQNNVFHKAIIGKAVDNNTHGLMFDFVEDALAPSSVGRHLKDTVYFHNKKRREKKEKRRRKRRSPPRNRYNPLYAAIHHKAKTTGAPLPAIASVVDMNPQAPFRGDTTKVLEKIRQIKGQVAHLDAAPPVKTTKTTAPRKEQSVRMPNLIEMPAELLAAMRTPVAAVNTESRTKTEMSTESRPKAPPKLIEMPAELIAAMNQVEKKKKKVLDMPVSVKSTPPALIEVPMPALIKSPQKPMPTPIREAMPALIKVPLPKSVPVVSKTPPAKTITAEDLLAMMDPIQDY
jgi:hypothetical protein